MDSIFAPWRIEWVQRDRSDEDDGCTFCNLSEGTNDRENLVVARSDHVYVLINNMPYNPGHTMVIPYDHVSEFHHLEESVLFDCMRTAQDVMTALDQSLSPGGFNVGLNIGDAGGASIVDHLHLHIIPRWGSDTSFMPLTGNTAVVEEAVDETYTRLREAMLDGEIPSSEGNTEAVSLSER